MPYNDSINQNAEFLRMVIPFLAKHQIPANPMAYAVCYQYFSGENPVLKNQIDALLNQGKEITQDFITTSYERYIANSKEVELSLLNDEIRKVINDLCNSADTADKEASQYHDCLNRYVGKLKSDSADFSVKQIIANLITDTSNMQNATAVLQAQLDENKREIEHLRDQLNQIRAEILTDALTGITNRKGFMQRIEQSMSQIPHELAGFTVMMVDIDKFKEINDTYGHLIGDKVIRFIASTLKEQVKGKDAVARFGGDEYVVMLLDSELQGAEIVAENIRLIVEKTRIKRNETGAPIGRVTVSIGIAQYQPGESVIQLLNRADAALYQSKNKGRNQISSIAASATMPTAKFPEAANASN